ncbi:MAG: pseudouridine synthase, partial [Rikenellaceae bacterium]
SVYIALNKPVGITSTTDSTDSTNIVDFVNYPRRIFNIGRLDKDSEGLILLTDDGEIVNKILRAGNKHEKEYIITVDRAFDDEFLKQMSSGVSILGQMTRRCKTSRETHNIFRITLTQGLNRQIRRMCEALGYEVTSLKRVRIMHITLDKLPLGQWRELTNEEVSKMLAALEGSTNNSKKSTPPKRIVEKKGNFKQKSGNLHNKPKRR